jgi:hypothetical protein
VDYAIIAVDYAIGDEGLNNQGIWQHDIKQEPPIYNAKGTSKRDLEKEYYQ